MHVVIVGGGQIGSALARALSVDHEVFVIDHQPSVADLFATMDVEFIVGSGTSEDVLGRAGVQHADVLVAATGLDEVNIVACAIANKLGNPQTICLVSRADFVDKAPADVVEKERAKAAALRERRATLEKHLAVLRSA